MMAAILSAIDVNSCQSMPPFPVGGSAAVDAMWLFQFADHFQGRFVIGFV